jgi:hypothetical protein
LPSEPLSDQPRVLPSQPERVVVGLVFAACLLWFGATSFFGVTTEDEAFLYVSARRMLVGDWPHRELESIYVLGRAWLLSGLFAIFGPTYLVERLFLGVLRAAAVTASYAGARSLLPRWASLVVALTVIAATGPPHKVFYALVPLCVLLPALRGLDGDDRWLLAAGVVAGVGCWVRQDTAIVAWLAALAAALAAGRRGRSVAALVGGALVGGGVPLAYVATQVDLERMFTEIVLYAFEDGQPGFERLAAVAEEGQIFPWPTVQLVWSIVAPSAALLGLVRAGHLTGAERGTWVLWSVVVALSSNQVFRENSLVRFLQAGAVAWPLIVGLAWQYLRGRARWILLLLPLGVGAGVGRAVRDGVAGLEYTGTVLLPFLRADPYEVDDVTFYGSTPRTRYLWRLDQMLRHAGARHGEPVVVYPRPTALYVATGRRHAGPAVYYGIRTRDRSRALADDLEKGRVAWVVLSFEYKDFPPGDAWRRMIDATRFVDYSDGAALWAPVCEVDPDEVSDPKRRPKRRR